MGTLLIIEDDPGSLLVLQVTFEGGSHTVKSATTFQEVLDVLPELTSPFVALVDENFPGGNGAQAAQVLRERVPGAKLISTSADEDRFIAWKPDARCQKPISIKVLLPQVEKLMKEATV